MMKLLGVSCTLGRLLWPTEKIPQLQLNCQWERDRSTVEQTNRRAHRPHRCRGWRYKKPLCSLWEMKDVWQTQTQEEIWKAVFSLTLDAERRSRWCLFTFKDSKLIYFWSLRDLISCHVERACAPLTASACLCESDPQAAVQSGAGGSGVFAVDRCPDDSEIENTRWARRILISSLTQATSLCNQCYQWVSSGSRLGTCQHTKRAQSNTPRITKGREWFHILWHGGPWDHWDS